MNWNSASISKMGKALYHEERNIKRLDGWFLAQEIKMNNNSIYSELSNSIRSARNLSDIIAGLPLYVSDNNIFVGTQRDAFAMSYALINPNFEVESFSGYCDPTAVFNDIEINETFTEERIERVKSLFEQTEYVKRLKKAYAKVETLTSEVSFFVEQVTGHTVCDFDLALEKGTLHIIDLLEAKIKDLDDEEKINHYQAMIISLKSVNLLGKRYAEIIYSKIEKEKDTERREQLEYMIATLQQVPQKGARNLFEAIQSYLLLWQTMSLEQVPNPFAFSVGNADRIFYKYFKMKEFPLDVAAAFLKHFLVFFNVGTRSWAISQNILISGKDLDGNDLTNPMSYCLLDAFYDMNLPQPILSVKIHKKTPNQLYQALGKFFFTPGCLTPSLFNDDSLFLALNKHGIEKEDLPNYGVAGCQEPLIKGKDSGNTTNSWLNMGKILELTINGGKSLLSGNKIGPGYSYFDENIKTDEDVFKNLKTLFYRNLEYYLDEMAKAANDVSRALSLLPVPFLSVFMGGIDSGYDVRDVKHQGTKYNGSGCLVHGLSVVGDSFIAVKNFLKQDKYSAQDLRKALKANFKGYEDLLALLKTYPKYGNNIEEVDLEVRDIAINVSEMIRQKKNYLNNSFRPDFSSPSTHLLYGYHVGATPDGRSAREMLGYGVDPLYGEATNGLGLRMLSTYKLPFHQFNGGYASHLGIDPNYFNGHTYEEKGTEFKEKIINTVFFSSDEEENPFYLYVNVTTAETLRAVLKEPKKYAPNGVYIMRIHGTFVNFLDLSPAIQEDIIKRLDNGSSRLSS
ncbi:MAG: pyruvate formate lyase family protein [Bacilli bacterium]|nr:pyruvate formate lyase family protein [Bacilli bacterium]